MCTLSIFPLNGGSKLVVTGNRDESRQRDEPGELRLFDDICYPVDGLAGGTWIGFNRSGLVIGLLNRYQDPLKTDVVTRGEIIPQLLTKTTLAEAKRSMERLDLAQYNPFDLVLASRDGIVHLLNNGVEGKLAEYPADKPFFITSSSVKAEYTLATRRALFDQLVEGKPQDEKTIIAQLHLSRFTGDDSASILMSRELSHTKSLCQIVVSPDEPVRFCYITQPLIEGIRDGEMDIDDALSDSRTIRHQF